MVPEECEKESISLKSLHCSEFLFGIFENDQWAEFGSFLEILVCDLVFGRSIFRYWFLYPLARLFCKVVNYNLQCCFPMKYTFQFVSKVREPEIDSSRESIRTNIVFHRHRIRPSLWNSLLRVIWRSTTKIAAPCTVPAERYIDSECIYGLNAVTYVNSVTAMRLA